MAPPTRMSTYVGDDHGSATANSVVNRDTFSLSLSLSHPAFVVRAYDTEVSRGEPCVAGACGLPFLFPLPSLLFSSLLVSSRLFSSPRATGQCFFAPSPPHSLTLPPLSATNCVARPRATSTVPYALNVAQEDHGAARTMDLGRLAARWLADGAPFAQRRCSSIVRTFTHAVYTCVRVRVKRRRRIKKRTPMATRRRNTFLSILI